MAILFESDLVLFGDFGCIDSRGDFCKKCVHCSVMLTQMAPLQPILDIIANKLLRLPAVNSKVVQSTGDLHHKIVILFFRISENVFDNATAFNPRNDVLNPNSDT
jgi:hypothetical protein